LRPVAIHQFVPVLAIRDAVGSHTLQAQAVLREMGFGSEIFVAEASSELAERVHPFRDYPGRGNETSRTWLLYQCSVGNLMADFLAERQEPKLLNYHNLTPAALLEGWDPGAVHAVTVGRHQLGRLAPEVVSAIAMSRFSELELRDAGYRSTCVVPPLFELPSLQQDVDSVALDRLGADRERGGADLLFVGRISPSKAQHDLVKALAAYRRVYDPRARLRLVGGTSSPSYREALGRFVGDLGLEEAVDFAGSVTPGELVAYFATADVFVCCSDHEGFCVPLLEAMHHGVPVVAYGAAAVPETVGAGGLVVPNKSPAHMAATVHRVVEDPELRQTLTSAGRARLTELEPARVRARFSRAIETAVSNG
jgi:glycosyltransferase involved in cell wall biosynthesis